MASEKITAIIEELKGLTVLELSELVHAVEDEFGVSAAAAETPNSSSTAFTSSESSRTVRTLSSSMIAVTFSDAIVISSNNFNSLIFK